MRTTLELDDALLRKAKKHAAEQGTTLSRLIEDSLRQRLAPRASGLPYSVELLVKNGPPCPGVDFASRESVLGAMEDGE